MQEERQAAGISDPKMDTGPETDERSDLMLDFLDNRPDIPGLDFIEENKTRPPAA
jgi:hypothetical protein